MPMQRAWPRASQASPQGRQTPGPACRPGNAATDGPVRSAQRTTPTTHTNVAGHRAQGPAMRPACRPASPHKPSATRRGDKDSGADRRPFRRPHSQPAAAISARSAPRKARPRPQNSAGSSRASRTTAVMTRCLSIVIPTSPRDATAVAHFPEAAIALCVGGQRGVEFGLSEVRPQAVREVELRVGRLPEHEVADADLATRADEQIGIGREVHRHVALQHGLVDLLGRTPDSTMRRQACTTSHRPP